MGGTEFGLLGPVRAVVNGTTADLGGSRPRLIFALLLCAEGAAVGEDRLIDALWGEQLPANARNSLHTHVSRLRGSLGEAGLRLRREPGGYRMVLGPGELDVERVQTLLRRARAVRSTAPGDASALLVEAKANWRGQPLVEFSGLADAALMAERSRLEELRIAVQVELLDAQLAAGRHAEVLPEAERAAAAEPLHERPQILLAIALYRSGRSMEALDVLRRYRERLAEETGLDPTEELERTETAILKRDLDLIEASAGAASAPPQLPSAPTSLIGRDDTLAAVVALLTTSRLVTLVGPGGIGKTRIALAAAHRWRDEVRWVDLAPVSDPALVTQAVADAVGVRQSGDRPLVEAIITGLAERPLLLVLDNAEHVAAAAARLVEALLGKTRRTTVLVTSRIALGLTPEHTLGIPPLPIPEATTRLSDDVFAVASCALFLQRARAARPDLVIDGKQAGLVGELCRRLDGIPLALELAAARLRSMVLEDVVARLGAVSTLRAAGPRALGRQSSVQATLDWSFELLAADEQAVLPRLSVFAGGWTLDDAAAVCADEDRDADTVDVVLRLVERSLVQPPAPAGVGPAWYRMLEPVRQYAERLLESRGSAERLRRRHAQHFARFAEVAECGLQGGEQLRWAAQVSTQTANLRAALTWASAPGRPDADVEIARRIAGALGWWWWMFTRHHGEARAWLEPLARQQGADGTTRGVGLVWLWAGWFKYDADEYEAAVELLGRAHDVLADQGDRRHAALALAFLAVAAAAAGDPERAAGCFRGATSIFQELGDQWGLGMVAVRAGEVARYGGDLASATEIYRTSAAHFRAAETWVELQMPLQDLGQVGLATGDDAGAVASYVESLQGISQHGLGLTVPYALAGLATVASSRGEFVRAARLFGASDAACARTGVQLQLIDRKLPDRARAAVQSAMGDADFERAYDAGSRLIEREAIAEALRMSSAAPRPVWPGSGSSRPSRSGSSEST